VDGTFVNARPVIKRGDDKGSMFLRMWCSSLSLEACRKSWRAERAAHGLSAHGRPILVEVRTVRRSTSR